MRWNEICLLFLLILIAACAGPAGLKAADDLVAKKDYLGAVKVYEKVLQSVKGDASQRYIEEKFENAKVCLVDAYLMQAGEQYLEMRSANIPSLTNILLCLQGVQQWDDANGRISSSIVFYKKKIKRIQNRVERYLSKAVIAAYGYEYNVALQIIDAAEKLDPENSSVNFARTRVQKRQVLYGDVLTLLADKDIDGAVIKFHQLAATFDPPPSLSKAPFAVDVLALIEEKVRSLIVDNRRVEAIDYLKGLHLHEVSELLKELTHGASNYFPGTAKTELKG
jgi:tetratricopeptide (TPR) repeat protein